jgi:hypothetical protein
MKIKEGCTYQLTHSLRGIYDVKIIYIGKKIGIYVEIIRIDNIWAVKETDEGIIEVGDHVKLTRGLVKFKELI